MIEPLDDVIWADQLTHKHECFNTSTHTIEVPSGPPGRMIRVRAPMVRDKPERLKILEAIESGDRLVLIGRHTLKDDDEDPWAS